MTDDSGMEILRLNLTTNRTFGVSLVQRLCNWDYPTATRAMANWLNQGELVQASNVWEVRLTDKGCL